MDALISKKSRIMQTGLDGAIIIRAQEKSLLLEVY
jgi:hypothetical protein